jgi:cytochrome c oxidase subunit IV
MSEYAAHEHVVPKSTYYVIFIALMVLTAVTVGAAKLHFGQLNFVIAIAIAITKASLVVLFFMHVKYSSPLVKITVGAGVFWLVILLSMIMMDYISRGWLSTPPLIR